MACYRWRLTIPRRHLIAPPERKSESPPGLFVPYRTDPRPAALPRERGAEDRYSGCRLLCR
jgi:hypothetical protein